MKTRAHAHEERASTCDDLLMTPGHNFNKRSCDQSERGWVALVLYTHSRQLFRKRGLRAKSAFPAVPVDVFFLVLYGYISLENNFSCDSTKGTAGDLLVTAYIVQHIINIQLLLLVLHGRHVQLPTHSITHLVLATKSVEPRTRHSPIAQSIHQQTTSRDNMCTVLAHALAARTPDTCRRHLGKPATLPPKPRLIPFEQHATSTFPLWQYPTFHLARLHVKILHHQTRIHKRKKQGSCSPFVLPNNPPM